VAARCLSVLFLAFAIASTVAAAAEFRTDKLTIVSDSGEYPFDVELAETSEQQSRGLMFRRSIGKREGMLFMHKEPRYITMWMRNTYIPLDMIFIRENGKIHRIEPHTEPFSERIIESGARVTAVLEVAAGVSQELGLKTGDIVKHEHFHTAE